MDLFNIEKYKFGIVEIDGKPFISSVHISELFGTRHSNTMRSIETAKKYIPDTTADFMETTCRMNNRSLPAYVVSCRVFEIVTKRLDNKALRAEIIAEFNKTFDAPKPI